MIVKHNITAMNSNRMLGLTTSSQAKSTEKLSSGYKVNRAADDAAGLAVSEKMRAQITGLNQAKQNAAARLGNVNGKVGRRAASKAYKDEWKQQKSAYQNESSAFRNDMRNFKKMNKPSVIPHEPPAASDDKDKK